MTHADITAFFTTYRDAFNRLDGDAVADLWHSPSGITDSGATLAQAQLTWWTAEAPMRANMRALCEAYRSNGFADAQFEVMDAVPMGANHAFARLRWVLRRTDGTVLQQFGTGYHVLRGANGWRVLMAVAYAETLGEMRPVNA